MNKITYEVDPFNRLVVNGRSDKSGLHKFRRVLDGKFSLDGKNNLIYRLRYPADAVDTVPRELVLKGIWRISKDHDLVLELDEEGRTLFGRELTLSGNLIDAAGDSLLFAVSAKKGKNIDSIYALQFKGAWQADKNNRLTFTVLKELGDNDILTFQNAWEIGKNNEIIYRYEKADLTTKKVNRHSVVFRGRWQIEDKARVSYALDMNSDSRMVFETSLGILKDNYIKYELGIRLANKSGKEKRVIELYGGWKIKKGVGLIFDVESRGKKINSLSFGADVALDGNNSLLFKLKDNVEKKDLGLSLRLSRKILKSDGEIFVDLINNSDEKAIYIGAAGKW